MFHALAILYLTTVTGAPSQMIHEEMSVDQVAEIFQTTPNLIPEYEVVQFHVPRRNKRDTKGTKRLITNAFGDDISLWLKPTEGALAGNGTPVFTARKNPRLEDIVYTEIPNAMKSVGKLLEDPDKKATLIFRTDSRGQYSFNGFIGSKNLVVRTLPESISYSLIKNRTSYDSILWENSGTTRSAYHVIFKREERNLTDIDKSIRLVKGRGTFSRFYTPVTFPPIPEVIYPEIMVVMDYDLFVLSGKSIDKALIYVLAFWNGVDLLYRSLENPKFRFNIARIVIAQDYQATPYLSQSMHNNELINAYNAHEAAQKHFFEKLNVFPARSYDAIMAMTGLQMTSGNGRPDTLGVALTRGACYTDYSDKTVGTLGITYDDGTFDGITTAAHEFAHLLGSRHDEGDSCKPSDGYIMAPSNGITKNSHDFSDCTVNDIDQFLKVNLGACFYNKPTIIDPLPRGLLPGELSDRNHQCEMLTKGKHCYRATSWQLPCSAIYCTHPRFPGSCQEFMSMAPPDGTYCGEGKVCLHRKCLRLPEKA